MVDESNTARTIGHGWASQKRYYVKEPLTPLVSSIAIDDALVPPCDLDETVLDATAFECNPGQPFTYFNCSTTTATYADTVAVVDDTACPGEDRLLQCELKNREVASNIVQYRKEIFEDAFKKSSLANMGMIANNEPLYYVRMDFKAPRHVTRAILRTTRNGNEHLRTGDINVYQDGNFQTLTYDFQQVETCALLIDFTFTGTSYAFSATAVELKPYDWFGFDYHGFKIDLFVVNP